MKKYLKFTAQILTGVVAILVLCASKAMAMSVQEGAEAARADSMPTELFGNTGIITQISNIALYIVGIISVAMLVWGGLRYVISGGDSKKVTDAKNTILYAIIGLIIAMLSYAIIHFVLNAVSTETTTEEQNTAQEASSENGEEPEYDYIVEGER